jgi:multimeric flavodoxin WrbA
MKILGISCSPRKNGNTDILVKQSLTGAANVGATPQFLTIRDLVISPCDGCYSCTKSGKCHINDDMQKVYKAMEESQAIIFGSPIYFWSICAQAKAIIDRTIALRFPFQRLSNKVGGIILVAGRKGCMNAAGTLSYWLASHRMFIADVVDGYAMERGDIERDIHAMKSSLELGRLAVKLSERGFDYPEEFNSPLYRFVENKYGVKPCPVPERS